MEITDLPVAASIDPDNDVLAIVTSNVNTTQQINRNTLLGISGDPVGNSDTQTLTNKTITSPTISSPTLSGTIAGTYTIGGTPTFPSSVATLTGTQTLANKTLTSPTINSPSITNASITADTLSGYTTSSSGTVYGISVSSGKVSGSIITSSTIPYTALTKDSTWAWQTWTPSWTNLTIGNATVTALYIQIGKLVRYRIYVTFGSTSSMGSAAAFSLPVTSSSNYVSQSIVGIGSSGLTTSSGYQGVYVAWTSTTKATLYVLNASSTYAVLNSFTSIIPFTWATGSFLTVDGAYEAA